MNIIEVYLCEPFPPQELRTFFCNDREKLTSTSLFEGIEIILLQQEMN